jgi:hypothetical protein
MPIMGLRIPPAAASASAVDEIAKRVLRLFREFHAAADRAKAIEMEILKIDAARRSVPEEAYSRYEIALKEAAAAHDLYAAARQELRDARAEERAIRQSARTSLLGCT